MAGGEEGKRIAGQGEARGALKRREWLDARPTYQDNGFHRSRCSVYTNPWQGVALDFHCIALSLTGIESSSAYYMYVLTYSRTHAHVYRVMYMKARWICSIAIFALLQRLLLVPCFRLIRKKKNSYSRCLLLSSH